MKYALWATTIVSALFTVPAGAAGATKPVADLGGMPSCQSYASQAPVPDNTKMRVRKALTNLKEWQKLYNDSWALYGEYDRRCKAYVENPTQDAFQIGEIGNQANTLLANLSELRSEANNMAPTVKSVKDKPKKTPGSFLELKKTIDKESEVFAKRKDQPRVELAKKCAATLDHHGSAIVDYMFHFENRAKTMCKNPAAKHGDDPGEVL